MMLSASWSHSFHVDNFEAAKMLEEGWLMHGVKHGAAVVRSKTVSMTNAPAEYKSFTYSDPTSKIKYFR
jgi:hypothetical protein